RFVEGWPIQNRWTAIRQLPAQTRESERLSKDLKGRGFGFVGPTIVYAHMQATGMVNDHLVSCFRHRPCARLARAGRLGPSPRRHPAPETTTLPPRPRSCEGGERNARLSVSCLAPDPGSGGPSPRDLGEGRDLDPARPRGRGVLQPRSRRRAVGSL